MKKYQSKKKYFGLFMALAFLSACEQQPDTESSVNSVNEQLIDMEDLKIPVNFNFSSQRQILISIETQTPNGRPATNMAVSVFINDQGNERLLINGQTDDSGWYQSFISVPADISQLLVTSSAMGQHNRQNVFIDDDSIEVSF